MSKPTIFAMVGPFVPANEPMTLIPYKQLRLLDATIYAATLRYKEDDSLKPKLEHDENYSKFHLLDLGKYNDALFSIHNVNLFKALWCKHRYIQNCVRWFDHHPTDIIYSSAFPQFNHSAALKIKSKYSNVRWVANFTDPINHSPYKYDKRSYKNYSIVEKVAFHVYCHFYVVDDIEAQCLENADALLFICEEQRDFMLEQYQCYYHRVSISDLKRKSIIYPLNYIWQWEEENVSSDSIGQKRADISDKITIGHFGRVYGHRLCAEFIEAVKLLFDQYPQYKDKLVVEQYGEFQKSDLKLIRELGLEATFNIQEKLDYQEYMHRLESCDYVLIFDTILPEDTIQPYLPSKVLEYSLLKKNTLSITTTRSPLYRIAQQSGALVAKYDRYDIENKLLSLLSGTPSILDYCRENQDLKYIVDNAFNLY